MSRWGACAMGLRGLLRRLDEASTEAVDRPWGVSAGMYQAALGVHAPWIAEISPMQYAHMGKAAKAAYDRKRAGEWEASGQAKEQWRQAVLAAFRDGKFDLKDAAVHPDAKSAVLAWQRDQEAAAAKAARADKDRENAITDVGQIKVGDTVFDIMSHAYEKVTKVSRKSVTVAGRFGPYRIEVSPRSPMLRWKAPEDL